MSDLGTTAEKSLEQLVFQVVTSYVFGKLKSKYGLEWKDASGNTEKEGEYDERRHKVAKEAFLAVRARTGADFVQYFSSTLFAVPQRLGEEGYLAVSRALLKDPETIRTLTLLALSARG